MTRYDLETEEEAIFYSMIESIRKYGGFYFGRYETGNLSSTTATVYKYGTGISSVNWYVMYEKCEGLSGENSNVTTSMTYGSTWCTVLRWLYDTEATISDGTTLTYNMIWSDSSDWGNYKNVEFEYRTSYYSLSTKASGTAKRVPSGSSEYTKANNIYDMAGNVSEYTKAYYSTWCRWLIGATTAESTSYTYTTAIDILSPTTYYEYVGCRAILWINN